MIKRLGLPAAAALLAALVLAAASLAGGPKGAGTAVEVTLTGDNCPQLPAGLVVTLTGVSRTNVDGRGGTHTIINGTATDNAGGSYRFNYHNNTRASGQSFPFDVQVSDHFNLVGNGGANHVHTHFVLRAHVTGPGPEDFEIFWGKFHGDPELCDPL